MANPDTSPQTRFFQRAIESAGPTFGIEIIAAPVRSDADIVGAIGALSGPQPGGLILPTDTYTRLRQGRIAELARDARVPTVSAVADFIDEGGLMFYGATSADQLASQYRGAASYVDRILKGAKPGELPCSARLSSSCRSTARLRRRWGWRFRRNCCSLPTG
jgi:putative ABC transport system substrate-binding protein